MADQNASVRQDQRIVFRIGIHTGDIIIDDNDIFGDGVNIAARLEGIAEPGGLCISDDASFALFNLGRFGEGCSAAMKSVPFEADAHRLSAHSINLV
jgi:class 3 adenylate cyclase